MFLQSLGQSNLLGDQSTSVFVDAVKVALESCFLLVFYCHYRKVELKQFYVS